MTGGDVALHRGDERHHVRVVDSLEVVIGVGRVFVLLIVGRLLWVGGKKVEGAQPHL